MKIVKFFEFSEYDNTEKSKSLSSIVEEITNKALEEAEIKIKELLNTIGVSIEDIFREVEDLDAVVKNSFKTEKYGQITGFTRIEFSVNDRSDSIIDTIIDCIERVERSEKIIPLKIYFRFAQKTNNINLLNDIFTAADEPKYKDAKTHLDWIKEIIVERNAKRVYIEIKW